MNKVKYLTVVIGCLIFSLICSFAVACEKGLKGDFFDESVLKRCEIEFLQKPENATNEVFSIDASALYKYSCEMESLSDFEDYAKSILQGFLDNNYTFGYYVESVKGESLLTSYYSYGKVYPSFDIGDYSSNGGRYYRFVYTPKAYNELKEGFGGRFMGHRYINLYIWDDANDNGKYQVNMEMYGGNSKSKWGFYIFEKDT